MIVIGIDPGATGALAAIEFNSGEVKLLWDIDLERTSEMLGPLSDLMLDYPGKPLAIIEHQQYMAKGGRAQGAKSAFALGVGYGFWKGFFDAFGAEVKVVRPQVWQKYHFGSGTVISDPKERSIRRATHIFPKVRLIAKGGRVPRHGRADALLIAAFGVAIVEARLRK